MMMKCVWGGVNEQRLWGSDVGVLEVNGRWKEGVMSKVANAQNISSFNLVSHSHETCTHANISQRSQTKAKVKGNLGKVCTPGGGAKVEHSGTEMLVTFLIRTMDEDGEKWGGDLHVRGLRSSLSEFSCRVLSDSQPWTTSGCLLHDFSSFTGQQSMQIFRSKQGKDFTNDETIGQHCDSLWQFLSIFHLSFSSAMS